MLRYDCDLHSPIQHNDIAKAAIMENRIVEEEDVEVRPEKVPTACIDENVCLESCVASHYGCCRSY